MVSKLRWKVALVLAVIVLSSVWAWYPPLADRVGVSAPGFLMQKRLALGLDLKGGVQFQLRVNVDEALRASAGVTRDEIVEQAKQAVDRRINELGVVEPLIAVQGPNRDELLVQLPGFADVTRARNVLGTTALLEWKVVDAGPASTRGALLLHGTVPAGTEIVETAPRHRETGGEPELYYRLISAAEVSGRDIRRASATQDANGLPAVGFSLTQKGGRRFAELTRANTGRQLAIVLDGRVQSAPVIENAITEGQGVIQGSFTSREANDLALVLRSGALPVSMTYLDGEYVGPTLGVSAIRGGVAASLMGLLLVAAFMVGYYRRAGMNAVISVIANLAILLGALALAGAALSLPGIAGLILTIGMGVDSNVLIFERIKEELKAGRPARSAMRHGFDRVLLTILDTHVASLIAAAFLFQFGTGAIRGFATTLALGLLANVFTAVVVSRTLFEISLSRSAGTGLGFWTRARATGRRSVDFLACRWYALAFSAAVVVACFAPVVARGGMPVGLDFTGGTAVVAKFTSPVSEDDVRRAIPGDETVQRYGPVEDGALLIRIPQTSNIAARMDREIEAGVTLVTTAMRDEKLPPFEVSGSRMVGAAIGADLQKKGVLATVASLAGISAYIALRFRPSFAAGAIVATTHDIVVTVAMLGAFGYDLSLNTVAAILTIAGYSVNDTIVIFDRVRENLRSARGMPIAAAVNLAVNQTLGRTIITAGATFLSVLALFLFGGEVLRGFAFAMLVGIVTGTYSTVFVAAPLAALLAKKRSTGSQ
jgi:SecD/SecF fusion protein